MNQLTTLIFNALSTQTPTTKQDHLSKEVSYIVKTTHLTLTFKFKYAPKKKLDGSGDFKNKEILHVDIKTNSIKNRTLTNLRDMNREDLNLKTIRRLLPEFESLDPVVQKWFLTQSKLHRISVDQVNKMGKDEENRIEKLVEYHTSEYFQKIDAIFTSRYQNNIIPLQ